MRGAVPCLSTDLTTHAVPHFIQALQMGRRDAVRGSDNGHLQYERRRALPVYGSDNPRRATLHTGLANGKARHCARIGHWARARSAARSLQMGRREAVRGSGNGRGRETRQGLQPGDVRSSLRRAAAGEGAKRDGVCSPVKCEVFFGARSSLRRAAAGEGAGAMCSSARVGEGEGAGACSSINFGWPGALLGGSVAFGSGCG